MKITVYQSKDQDISPGIYRKFGESDEFEDILFSPAIFRDMLGEEDVFWFGGRIGLDLWYPSEDMELEYSTLRWSEPNGEYIGIVNAPIEEHAKIVEEIGSHTVHSSKGVEEIRATIQE